ncbi:methyl-accepting chemotaxis protein [Thermodesulfovibrio yellowstonii]|uniref:methyl-accepting chemotaxis protein n=1 Tax=Thermodesulfovibrio yellowstonii TaxID=28262 RepID=UPI003C79C300
MITITKKRIIGYMRLIGLLIPVALFFTFFDVIIFSKISFLHEKLRLSVLIFSAMITSSIICIYLSRKQKIHLYEKQPTAEEIYGKNLTEAHKFCSEQRKLFNDMFDLFSKNLEDTVKKTEESITEFIKILDSLYQKTKEQTELIKSSIGSGEDLLAILDRQIHHNSEILESLNNMISIQNKNLKEDLERIYTLQKKVHDIIPLMDSIKDISEQINILAINAAIESARVGEKGAGFAVIADEIRKLSNKTEKISKEIKDKISSLNSTMTEQYEFFKIKLEGTKHIEMMKDAKEATEEIEKDFSNVGNLLNRLINDINLQNELIFTMVTDLLGKVQFQDVVRQKLEKICEQMKELSDYNHKLLNWVENPKEETRPPQIKTLLDKFYQSYVMRSQRKIHAEVFNETHKVDTKEPKIELF